MADLAGRQQLFLPLPDMVVLAGGAPAGQASTMAWQVYAHECIWDMEGGRKEGRKVEVYKAAME